MNRPLTFIFSIFVAIIVANSAQGAAKVRGWIFLDYNMDYLRSALPKAKQMHVNHVEFSHDIVMKVEQIFDNPQLERDLRELTHLYKSNGIEAFLWTHEFEAVPPYLMTNGRINMDDPEFYEWLAGKYVRLAKMLPDLDGVVLTMSETWRTPFRDEFFNTKLNRSQRVTKLVTTIHDAIKPYGMRVWIRTWGNLTSSKFHEYLEVAEGINNCPPDVTVSTKHTAGDFYLLVRSPLLGSFKGRDEIVELDPAGEFFGQSVVPWCAPEYFKSEWDYAASKGVDGAVARIDRLTNNGLGTPNEVSIYAISRYLMDSSATPEQCWQEWAEARFGKEAAPAVISALKKTFEISLKTFFTFRCCWIQDHSNVSNYSYSPGHLRGRSAAELDKELAVAEAKLLNPTPAVLDEVMEEKDRSVLLCREAIDEIEGARDFFQIGDFLWLKEYLNRSLLLAKVYRAVNEVYMRAELCHKGEGTMEELEAAIYPLLSYADYIEKRYGSDVRLVGTNNDRGFIVRQLRNFAKDARARATSAGEGD